MEDTAVAGSQEERLEEVVTIADRPDLIPTVVGWLWEEFWRHDGYSFEDTRTAVAASVARSGPPQTFVTLLNGRPVGTASLAAEDLDERPNLTPWLAGVYVVPEARGCGYATKLVATVEQASRLSSIPVIWLYTNTAERLYKRVGWQTVEVVEREGKRPVTLMRKSLKA